MATISGDQLNGSHIRALRKVELLLDIAYAEMRQQALPESKELREWWLWQQNILWDLKSKSVEKLPR